MEHTRIGDFQPTRTNGEKGGWYYPFKQKNRRCYSRKSNGPIRTGLKKTQVAPTAQAQTDEGRGEGGCETEGEVGGCGGDKEEVRGERGGRVGERGMSIERATNSVEFLARAYKNDLPSNHKPG